ncbi:MAG: hypothetical protein FWF95_06565 [Syntrophorhabdaceae bacterium]|nr:hypothetical protein [Syntrophorhabdaceae bacterium]
MGLGITIKFPVGQCSKTDKEFYKKYFTGLRSVVPDWNISCFSGDAGFRVKLVPFEEDIYCTWEDEILCIYAKTNSAGPGYHAYLIDVLDGLGVTPVEVEDETKYYNNRNFSLLQNEMAAWLHGLSNKLLEMSEEGGYSNIAVSLSIDSTPQTDEHFTCCPLGYFEKDFFEKVKEGEPAGIKFFPWWNKPQDALFFKNAAMNLILCEINWLPPETATEQEAVAAALGCLEKAYALNPDLEYPVAEWIEIARISGNESLVKKLHSRFGITGSGKLGYKRGFVSSNYNGWRFTHSGQMHFDREEDGSPVWWDSGKTIRVSTFSVQFKEDTVNKSESLLRSATEKEAGYEPLALRNSEIAASIQHTQIEENGEPLFQTRLAAALNNELVIMSLFYVDANDREWAVKVCASVAR